MDGVLVGNAAGVLAGVLAELVLLGRREVFFPFLLVPVFFFLGVLVLLLGLVVGVVVAGVVVVGEDICARTAGAVRATGAATTRDRSKAFAILVM